MHCHAVLFFNYGIFLCTTGFFLTLTMNLFSSILQIPLMQDSAVIKAGKKWKLREHRRGRVHIHVLKNVFFRRGDAWKWEGQCWGVFFSASNQTVSELKQLSCGAEKWHYIHNQLCVLYQILGPIWLRLSASKIVNIMIIALSES